MRNSDGEEHLMVSGSVDAQIEAIVSRLFSTIEAMITLFVLSRMVSCLTEHIRGDNSLSGLRLSLFSLNSELHTTAQHVSELSDRSWKHCLTQYQN
jgi:hypothetical protein